MQISEEYLFNIILVHVSRTWERIRLEQEFQEMPYDNIESVDKIIDIAQDILNDKVIQKFYETIDDDKWDWDEETSEGCSDAYIERLATELIYSDVLEINNISREDYIIWNTIKEEPVDDLDTVYHHSTIIEMLNNFEISLQEGEEFKCVAELPLKWQYKINIAIQNTK